MSKIEDFEQYCGIREYREELSDELTSQSMVGHPGWFDKRSRLEDIDWLIEQAERDHPDFLTRYLTAPSNLGTL